MCSEDDLISCFLPLYLQSSVLLMGITEDRRCYQKLWLLSSITCSGSRLTSEDKSPPSISRPAKYKQVQCMLAPYNVLPVYFRNDRMALDLCMRRHFYFHAWAACLKLPAGIDPDGYSWCLSCEQYRSYYLRWSISHTLGRDRDWIYGPEVDELLSCDPQFILLTCQEWAVLNYIKSTTINNARNGKAKAMQFDKRTWCKRKKPFK